MLGNYSDTTRYFDKIMEMTFKENIIGNNLQ